VPYGFATVYESDCRIATVFHTRTTFFILRIRKQANVILAASGSINGKTHQVSAVTRPTDPEVLA
jgi:hypothetical protein